GRVWEIAGWGWMVATEPDGHVAGSEGVLKGLPHVELPGLGNVQTALGGGQVRRNLQRHVAFVGLVGACRFALAVRIKLRFDQLRRVGPRRAPRPWLVVG